MKEYQQKEIITMVITNSFLKDKKYAESVDINSDDFSGH